jgi:pullulanase-type alpha-1,6-glucosidase
MMPKTFLSPRPVLRLAIVITVATTLLSPLNRVYGQPIAQSANPDKVGLPGTHQDELGCPGEWQPDCDKTLLIYDAEDDVWQATFEIQPANDDDKKGPRYKAALNGGWSENYGAKATPGGTDIPLVVTAPTEVKFYYDHKTHWITDNFNTPIFVAAGNFQKQLGCSADNDPGCLRSWLEDPDGDGVYSLITRSLKAGTYSLTLTLNEDAAQTVGDTQDFTVAKDSDAIYFGYDAVKQQLTISTTGAPAGNITKQRAQWLSTDTLLWNIAATPGQTYALVYSADAALELAPEGINNGTEIPLAFVSAKPDVDLLRKYPYLRDYAVFKVTETDRAKLAQALKGQVAVIARGPSGQPVDASGVQMPGVLDDLYSYNGPLGVTFEGDVPTLRVWAPTAQAVTLYMYDTETASYAKKTPMDWDTASGVWSITGAPDWKGKYYLYEVKVFAPSTGKIETNLVTDPYSLSLSINSQRSQVVNLADPTLKPEGWDAVAKPALAAPEDIVVYELHIRDFSVSDQTVPEELRGTYKAFTVKESNGLKHLAALAQAGLTHIHLLPAFDIASIDEDKSTWGRVDETKLAAEAADSDQQSLAVSLIKGTDGFNWGYDPYHYTTPEGSYATDPNGTSRIVEFREMVQALNQIGLRVVMDVVYNHTNASGQAEKSVLDKVVPGYYHRLNADGNVEHSTCCENTATEHAMMRKLMIDSLLVWAKDYQVDGFRFDLMGHHMLEDMKAVRAALDSLTLEKDGVDGKAIYVYGEGWDFGEVANNSHGKNATQLNIAGTGIGVFNDRLRDAVRGGSPFSDPRDQGFATGLLLADNDHETRALEDQQLQLFEYADWIKLSLAGNLADFSITRADGKSIVGRLIGYNNAPAGYTADPQENIVYVSAHDNETLWDAIQFKAPTEATLADRIRMNNLALDIVMLSQGIPFFHAGDDLLRSKSLDRNSYDSGDWFNKLDFTYQSNNFGVGLPIEGTDNWPIMKPLLANADLKPTQADIESAAQHFQIMLKVRKSSPLFRLQTADQIKRALTFLNNGPDQTPGLIVMQLTDVDSLDPNYDSILVLFNATPKPVSFTDASLKNVDLQPFAPLFDNNPDPALAGAAFDSASGTFTVPGRTTVVYAVGLPPQAAVTPTVAATAVAITPTATPTSPAGFPDTFTLNAIAVGVAIIGALIGFVLARRAITAVEPEPKGGKKNKRKK